YADRTASTDAWIEQCKEKFNITIELQNVPTDQYAATLKTKISASDIPDLVSMHDIGRDYQSKGEQITVDKNMFLDIKDLTSVQDYLSGVIENVTRDGKVFYVPVSTNSLGVIYNKNVFKDNGIEIPKNINEFTAAMDQLKAAGV